MATNKRPVYLNLPRLASKMSITAKVSILHRVSGVVMFLAIPLVLYLLQKSLQDPNFYAMCSCVYSWYLMRITLLILVWALMHHMCAGVRFLFLDVEIGVDKTCAQKSAYLVIAISLLLTIVIGVLIW